MKPVYFVNTGVNPSHIRIHTKMFTLLRDAKRYILTIDTTETRSQCWELVRVTNYGAFTSGKENMERRVLGKLYTSYGKPFN